VIANRVALIKGYLNRTRRGKGGDIFTMELDKGRKEVSYCLGRLLAVADRVQYFSLGYSPNRSLSDSYIGSLSVNPKFVFQSLMCKVNAHVRKIKREKVGLGISLDKELCEIVSEIKDIPNIFSMDERSEFILGYYQQKKSYIKKNVNENII
jgi:CRISPR-associated protein Csd1